jgi:hypothetical protein
LVCPSKLRRSTQHFCFSSSSQFPSAPKYRVLPWKRAGKAIERHPGLTIVTLLGVAILVTLLSVPELKPSLARAIDLLVLPGFLNWRAVILYAFLALVAYLSQKVLTSAIGCLAVYLGADDLSKNFAARSQILHECTTTLINLLAGCDETGKPDQKWTTMKYSSPDIH